MYNSPTIAPLEVIAVALNYTEWLTFPVGFGVVLCVLLVFWALWKPTQFGNIFPVGLVLASLGFSLYWLVLPRTTGSVALVEASFILISGIVSALLIVFFAQLATHKPFSIERIWGTFGGAADGYVVTPPVAVIAVIVACLFALVVISYEVGTAGKEDATLEGNGDLNIPARPQ